MRSSKNRSRSKSNRQRSLGNVVNRVFDSSGPEGKVRGTPQQIIDKYLALARDAQLSNDRVAEQNFLQHAEHFTRMLGDAQREMTREQEQRQQSQGDGQQNNGHQNTGQQNIGGDRQSGHRQRSDEGPGRDPRRDAGDTPREEAADDDGPGLVETPEARHRGAPGAPMMPEMPQPAGPSPAAAEKKPRPPRKPRVKRPQDDAVEASEKPDRTGDTPPADATG